MSDEITQRWVFLPLLIGALAASPGCSAPFSRCERDERCSGAEPVSSEVSRPLTLGCWNLQWFGSPSEGPEDDELQFEGVRDLIRATDVDVWALVEIAEPRRFDELLAALDGYEGVLGQSIGVLYKSRSASLLSSQLVLAAEEYEFGGRSPLEATLELEMAGERQNLVVIALHAKAFDDEDSWQRRQSGSLALERYLDQSYPFQKVAVLGDFNDDVDASISPGEPSPYENFVAARARYSFPTAALSAAGKSSTLQHAEMIDHHLVTNELMASYLDGSAALLDVEDTTANRAWTVSDHRPVITRYER